MTKRKQTKKLLAVEWQVWGDLAAEEFTTKTEALAYHRELKQRLGVDTRLVRVEYHEVKGVK